jgi:polysaccharide pyruvyl transferase WcaK-like protein
MRHWYPYAFEVPDEAINEHMLGSVAGVLDYLVEEHDADVSFLPLRTTARDDDREACSAVQARMRTDSCLYDEADPGVEETMARLVEADLVIGMRLHASIIATTMGIPAVALAYMPKVRDYMESIGQDDACVDIEALTKEGLVGILNEVLTHYEERSQGLLHATGQAASRFQRNRELLYELLDETRAYHH